MQELGDIEDPLDEVASPEESITVDDLDPEGGYTPWPFVAVSDEQLNHEVCFCLLCFEL